jgi:hypothetical protein
MVIYQTIIDCAKQQQKNILILGSPRSGTHALSAELCAIGGANNLAEICKTGYCDNPWNDINKLSHSNTFTIAQIVQLTPKILLAENVGKIKQHNIIVNIKRLDKIKQFASWIYFRVMDPTGLHGWHNHTAIKTKIKKEQITANKQDIDQFKLEQLIDDYFLPDFVLCYENLTFNTQKNIFKNQFAFPLPEIFSNLNYVEEQLGPWQYSQEHFFNE